MRALACAVGGHLGCGSLLRVVVLACDLVWGGVVRDTNVYSPSCERWWSELCGRKVVLRVRMPVTEQLCVVVLLLHASGWPSLGRCAALLSRPECGCVIVVLVICTDGAPTES